MTIEAAELLAEAEALQQMVTALGKAGSETTAGDLEQLDLRGEEFAKGLADEDRAIFLLYWRKKRPGGPVSPQVQIRFRAPFMAGALRDAMALLEARRDGIIGESLGVQSSPVASRRRERPLILIIDDEVDLRQIVKSCGSKWGCDVIEAGGGVSGIQMALEHHPDLIILDVIMPGMGGLEVLKWLRSEPSLGEPAVLLLTAVPVDPQELIGGELQASDYLEKPLTLSCLAGRVKRLLYLESLRRDVLPPDSRSVAL